MSPEQCSFRVSKEDFLKLPPPEQISLIYVCLVDMQEKVDWKWRRVMTIGAVAGLAGGFLHNIVLKFLGIQNL